jgi:phosphoglycolate phosphatase-like HAD superfamily hydrolase
MKAAKAAGCKCLAITSSFKAEEFDRADWVVDDMTRVPDDCLNW